MMREFSLSELSKLVNIPVRKLRYVLDHDLVPERGWFVADDEPGTPRKLDDISACFVVSAAMMLESGCRRENVRGFFAAVEKIQPKGRNPLGLPAISDAFISEKDVYLLYADNTHIRCIVGKQDSGWLKVGKKLSPDKGFVPMITTTVHLGKIRDLLK